MISSAPSSGEPPSSGQVGRARLESHFAVSILPLAAGILAVPEAGVLRVGVEGRDVLRTIGLIP